MFLTFNYQKIILKQKLRGVISNLKILTIPPFIPKTRLTLAREEAEQTESQLLQEPLRDFFQDGKGSCQITWFRMGFTGVITCDLKKNGRK